jgi:hypothetical protein
MLNGIGVKLPEKLFEDKVSMSIKNWYFQEAASANAEAIIFLHDYVMSYLWGILIVVLILIIVLGVLFTWTNDKREIVINFLPKGSSKLFVVVPFKKWFLRTDVTLLRLSQPLNPVYTGMRKKYLFWAKYLLLVKRWLLKTDKVLNRLHVLRKVAKKNKDLEESVNKIIRWYKKTIEKVASVDESDIGFLFSNKYPVRKDIWKPYMKPKQKLRKDLIVLSKLYIRDLKGRVTMLIQLGWKQWLWRVKLHIKGIVFMLSKLNKVNSKIFKTKNEKNVKTKNEKNLKRSEGFNLNRIRFWFLLLEELLFNKEFRTIFLEEELKWEVSLQKWSKRPHFQGIPYPVRNLLEGINDEQSVVLTFKFALFERRARTRLQQKMPSIIFYLDKEEDISILVRKYTKLVVSLWKDEKANFFDVYTVWEKKGKGALISPKIDNSYSLRVENKCHNLTLELLWTLVPAMILLIIGAPSLATLYSLEEVVAPEITVKVVGINDFELMNIKC